MLFSIVFESNSAFLYLLPSPCNLLEMGKFPYKSKKILKVFKLTFDPGQVRSYSKEMASTELDHKSTLILLTFSRIYIGTFQFHH